MTDTVNPITGEVSTSFELVPLDLASLDEEALLARFPTPVQAAGALLYARQVNQRAPEALNRLRTALVAADRTLFIMTALAVRDLAADYPRATLTERRMLAVLDERVKAAQDARDEAWLLLEYARDYDKANQRDIDILRSLNANLRGEHQ